MNLRELEALIERFGPGATLSEVLEVLAREAMTPPSEGRVPFTPDALRSDAYNVGPGKVFATIDGVTSVFTVCECAICRKYAADLERKDG